MLFSLPIILFRNAQFFGLLFPQGYLLFSQGYLLFSKVFFEKAIPRLQYSLVVLYLVGNQRNYLRSVSRKAINHSDRTLSYNQSHVGCALLGTSVIITYYSQNFTYYSQNYSYAQSYLLFPKLCQHNVPMPTYFGLF